MSRDCAPDVRSVSTTRIVSVPVADEGRAACRSRSSSTDGRLPNGTGAYLNTWDAAQGNVTVVNWSGVNRAFDDQYSAFMTWSDPAAARPYRCMWTNELR